MTGFARIQGHDQAVAWTWEAKSVNGRGLEVRCRLPSGYDALEMAAREAAAKRFKRGSLNITLTLTRAVEQSSVRINEPLLAELIEKTKGWRRRWPEIPLPGWDGLLSLKGVMEAAEETGEADEARAARDAALLAALTTTLDAMADMRRAEGAKLAAVLSGQLDEIAALAERAASSTAMRPEAIRERLRQQLATLLEAVPTLPEERLAQEAALLVAKGDVREELDRLKAHITAARDLIGGGAVGRKLDFLCQEFNREANTFCSKSADVDLTRIGLDLKAVIEQFREQVQNIE